MRATAPAAAALYWYRSQVPFILGTKQYAAPLEATEELIYPPSQGFREALIYRYVFGTVSYAAILTPY